MTSPHSECRVHDDHEVIDLVLEGSRVSWVSVRTNWQSHYTPVQLGVALTQLLDRATGEQHVGLRRRFVPPGRKALHPDEIRQRARAVRTFVEESTKYSRLVRARTAERRSERVTSANGRVSMSFVNGAPGLVEIEDEWAARATANAISEAITEVLEGLDLSRRDADPDPDLSHLENLWNGTIARANHG